MLILGLAPGLGISPWHGLWIQKSTVILVYR